MKNLLLTFVLLGTVIIADCSTLSVVNYLPDYIAYSPNRTWQFDISDFLYLSDPNSLLSYQVNNASLPTRTTISQSQFPADINLISARLPETDLGEIDTSLPALFLADNMTIYWSQFNATAPPQISSHNQTAVSVPNISVCFDAIAINSTTIAIDCSILNENNDTLVQNNLLYYTIDDGSAQFVQMQNSTPFGSIKPTQNNRRELRISNLTQTDRYIYRFSATNSNLLDIFDTNSGNLSAPTYTITNDQTYSNVQVLNGIVVANSQNGSVANMVIITPANDDQHYDNASIVSSALNMTVQGWHLQYDIGANGFRPQLQVVGNITDNTDNNTLSLYHIDLGLLNHSGIWSYSEVVGPIVRSNVSLNLSDYNTRSSANFHIAHALNGSVLIYLRKQDRGISYLYEQGSLQDIQRVWFDQKTENLYVYAANQTFSVYKMERPVLSTDKAFDDNGSLSLKLVNSTGSPICNTTYLISVASSGEPFGYGQMVYNYVEKFPNLAGMSELDLLSTNLTALQINTTATDIQFEHAWLSLTGVESFSILNKEDTSKFYTIEAAYRELTNESPVLYALTQDDSQTASLRICTYGDQFNIGTELLSNLTCTPIATSSIGDDIEKGSIQNFDGDSGYLFLTTKNNGGNLSIYKSDFSQNISLEVPCDSIQSSYEGEGIHAFCFQKNEKQITGLVGSNLDNVDQYVIDKTTLNLTVGFTTQNINTYKHYPGVLFVYSNESVVFISLNSFTNRFVAIGFIEIDEDMQQDVHAFIAENQLFVQSASQNQTLSYDITNLRAPVLINQTKPDSRQFDPQATIFASGSEHFYTSLSGDDNIHIFNAKLPDFTIPVQSLADSQFNFTQSNTLQAINVRNRYDLLLLDDGNGNLLGLQIFTRPRFLFDLYQISPNNQNYSVYENLIQISYKNKIHSVINLDLFLTDYFRVKVVEPLPEFKISPVIANNESQPINYTFKVNNSFSGPFTGDFELYNEDGTFKYFDFETPTTVNSSSIENVTSPQVLAGFFVPDTNKYVAVMRQSTNDSLYFVKTDVPFNASLADTNNSVLMGNTSASTIINSFNVSTDQTSGIAVSNYPFKMVVFFDTHSLINFQCLISDRIDQLYDAFVLGHDYLRFAVLQSVSNQLYVSIYQFSETDYQITEIDSFRVGPDNGNHKMSAIYINNNQTLTIFISNFKDGFKVINLNHQLNEGYLLGDQQQVQISQDQLFTDLISYSLDWVSVVVHSTYQSENDGLIYDLILVPKYGASFYVSWSFESGMTAIWNSYYPYGDSLMSGQAMVQNNSFVTIGSLSSEQKVGVIQLLNVTSSYGIGSFLQDKDSLVFTQTYNDFYWAWTSNSTDNSTTLYTNQLTRTNFSISIMPENLQNVEFPINLTILASGPYLKNGTIYQAESSVKVDEQQTIPDSQDWFTTILVALGLIALFVIGLIYYRGKKARAQDQQRSLGVSLVIEGEDNGPETDMQEINRN